MKKSIDYRVYLVTDDPSRYEGDWLGQVASAVDGGVTCVQYRDTENGDREQYYRLRALKDLLSARGVPLIVNNNVGLALAVGADGIHVGQNDLPPTVVRALVGERMEIGYSITSISQLADRADEVAAADVLGIGPVFDATATKADAAPEMGTAGLSAIVASVRGSERVRNASFESRKRLVAIGGINLERAAKVLASGVDGLAVVSAISRSPDPGLAARAFAALSFPTGC